MQQYIIVSGAGSKALCDEVNRLIADGWVPLGAPFRTGVGRLADYSPKTELSQALVCGDLARRLEAPRT